MAKKSDLNLKNLKMQIDKEKSSLIMRMFKQLLYITIENNQRALIADMIDILNQYRIDDCYDDFNF